MVKSVLCFTIKIKLNVTRGIKTKVECRIKSEEMAGNVFNSGYQEL